MHVNDFFYQVQHPPSFIGDSEDIRWGGERSYAHVIELFAFLHRFTFRIDRIGLDEYQEGLLWIDDGFYLHLTEDHIYETN